MRLIYVSLLVLALAHHSLAQAILFNMNIVNKDVVQPSQSQIYLDGKLNEVYDDTIYEQSGNCRNGYLNIINTTFTNSMAIRYSGLITPVILNQTNTIIDVSPNQYPKPNLNSTTTTDFTIYFNCPTQITDNNYYNKVTVSLPQGYIFSFLLNCDPSHRHKPFQFGYLILSIINAAIIIGVAMNSHIWSITFKTRSPSVQLKWVPFAIFNVVSIIVLVGFTLFAVNDFSSAFVGLRYFGIAISAFFSFLCLNEILYLVKYFQTNIYKILRICDFLSFGLTAIIIIIACLYQSWILYDILASFICVGCIKLFYFNTLKQAFLSMGIYVVNVTTIAITLHYILSRSYNDYASELSSPLFLQVPDLINGLFKKCSWLVVVDTIVPGVTLSYLRTYDENKGSKYGGVYTVWGNITFISATTLWVGLEAVYPFSIPFSLVTYLSLMLAIFLIAWKRNDWKTLVQGTFQKSNSSIKSQLLEDKQQRFSVLVKDEVFQPLRKSVGRDSKDSRS